MLDFHARRQITTCGELERVVGTSKADATTHVHEVELVAKCIRITIFNADAGRCAR